MSKASEFSQKMMKAIKDKQKAESDIANAAKIRPTYQCGILFASVTNEGNLESLPHSTLDKSKPYLPPEEALALGKWLVATFV